MSKKIGFIGYGNMSSAMIKGLVKMRNLKASNIMVTDIDEDKVKAAGKETGVCINFTAREIAGYAHVLIIAVKPDQYQGVIDRIKAHLKPEAIVVSIAAGLTIETLESYFDKPTRIVRTMPNTPAMVNAGMTALMPNVHVTPEDLERVSKIFNAFGKSEVVSESLIDAAIVTSGSAPAYVYMMIEAMIEGGMNEGMSQEMATTFVTQAVLGAAKVVMETGVAPHTLRDAVCSPNGTTIEAVNYLKDHHFAEIVQNAMKACADRSREMSKS